MKLPQELDAFIQLNLPRAIALWVEASEVGDTARFLKQKYPNADVRIGVATGPKAVLEEVLRRSHAEESPLHAMIVVASQGDWNLGSYHANRMYHLHKEKEPTMKPVSGSLGAKLHRNRALAADAKRRAEIARDAESKRKNDLTRAQVIDFLDLYKRQVIEIIEAEGEPKRVRIPRYLDSYKDTENFWHPANANYDLWAAFVAWAKREGLDAQIGYDHDGVGRESWHTIYVDVPK